MSPLPLQCSVQCHIQYHTTCYQVFLYDSPHYFLTQPLSFSFSLDQLDSLTRVVVTTARCMAKPIEPETPLFFFIHGYYFERVSNMVVLASFTHPSHNPVFS